MRINIFSLLLFIPSLCFAIGFEDATQPEIVTTTRAYGMGSAYLSKVDDAWAAFYNPAGLGTVRKANLHLGNFHFESNKSFMDVMGGAVEDMPDKFGDITSAEGTRALLANNPGKMIHSRLGIYPNLTFRYFSIGYLYNQQNRAILPSLTDDFELAERRDHGPVVAANVSLFGGILKIGASAIYLNRKELFKEVAPTDPLVINDSDYQTGRMWLITGGMRLTLPFMALPALSVVVRNTGNQEFTKYGSGGSAPEKIKQTVDVGFSLTPQIGRATRIHLEVDYRDVNEAYDTVDNNRRLQAGVEFDYARMFFVRFGYGDGFGSFGLGVRNKSMIVDLATYAVDTTEGEWRGNEDRRFALTLSSGF